MKIHMPADERRKPEDHRNSCRPDLMRGVVSLLGIVAALLGGMARAQTYQWNGSNSTVWTTAGNWQPTGGAITAGPGPTGGTFNRRLNVNNGVLNELVYDSSLGTTVYSNTANSSPNFRGIVVGSGSSGRMRITGGTFSTAGSASPDAIGNGPVTAELIVAGGSFIGNTPGIQMGLGAGPITRLIVSNGTATVTTVQMNSTTATVEVAYGLLTAGRLQPVGGTSVFNFNAGTLRPSASTTNLMSGLTRANVRDGGATIDTAGFDVTVGQALEHSNIGDDASLDGGLTKTGAGALTLTNTNTYNGPTSVNGGALWINGALSTGAVTIAGGASLGGGGGIGGSVSDSAGSLLRPGASAGAVGTLAIAGDLALAGADTVRVDVASAASIDRITVGGNLTPAGVTFVELNGNVGSLPSGEYTLMEIAGALNGATTNFFTPQGMTRSTTLALAYDTTSTPRRLVLNVVVGGAPSNLVWKGGGDQWDVVVSQNWLNGGVDDYFYNDDFVTFNATGVAQPNVNLAGPVFPGGVTVDTSAGDYAFLASGSGRIGGAAGLTKNGAGKLTISTPNDNTGATVINAGTLQLGNGGATGASGSGPVANNGELALDRSDSFTLGNEISGAGSLTKRGAGTVTLTATNSYGATVVLAGTLQAGAGGSNGTFGAGAITNDGTLVFNRSDNIAFDPAITGTGAVTKLGAGLLALNASNDYAGATVLSAGAIVMTNGHALGPASGMATVTVNATLGLSGGADAPAGKPLVLSGPGALAAGYFFPGSFGQRGALQSLAGSNTWRGPIRFSSPGGNTRIGVQDGAQLVLTGTITETAPVSSLFFRHGNTAGSDILVAGTNSSWTGETQVFGAAGAVKLGADNALATGALLRVGTSGIGGTSTLDLNGFSQSAAGLNRVGSGTALVVNRGSVPATLTLNPVVPVSYFGSIEDGSSAIAFVKTGPSIQQFASNNAYSGSTTIEGGALELIVDGGMSLSTNIHIAAAASLVVTQRVDGAFNLGASQRMGGSGSVIGNLTSAGTVAPGSSAGVLTVSGSYTQSFGSLEIEIGGPAQGTDYDALVVGADAVLAGGTLKVSFINGYAGTAGHSFTVLSAASLSGVLTATNLPVLGGGNGWDVQQTATSILLSITNGAPPPGGYNAWSNLYALALGPDGDDDGDGFANLLEYVTGGNPTNGDLVSLMSATRSGGTLALRFSRDTNAADTTLIVEGGNSVANDAPWLGIATNTGGSWGGATNVGEMGTGALVSVTAQDTVAAATNRFLRLRVTRP